jgi:gliding motility-associated-like protein
VTVPPSEIKDYNVFTPNDDQFNNVFRLIKEDDISFRSFEAKIYSRWGQVVCEWFNVEDAKRGWDGTIGNKGGVKASPGLYFVVYRAVGKDDQTWDSKRKTVTVHLYR